VNGLTWAFLIVAFVAILTVPRRWVSMPFLIGACYLTYGQGIEVGGLTFYVIRLLLLGGFVRVVLRGEWTVTKFTTLDRLMVAWCAAAVLSSVGHGEPSSSLVYRLGIVYDYGGTYFLFRVLIRSFDELVHASRITAIVLAPVAFEMLLERVTGQNRFAGFGGVPEICQVRQGKIRAQGPFMHPILAGTVGAVCLPLMVGMWRRDRRLAGAGIVACLVIVVTSGSSGPAMSAIFAGMALWFWSYRKHMRTLRWVALGSYIILDLVMKVPAYYLLARLDLAGGSTGWHRAELIDSAIRHLPEWWLTGTDYTRHWMPTGVTWSPNHTDITNQYILFGIIGGLPLMLLFIGVIVVAFSNVGKVLRNHPDWPVSQRFFLWGLGAALFANVATCVSVAYFDQSFLFLFMTLGSIGAVSSILGRNPVSKRIKTSDKNENGNVPALGVIASAD
jgi:hypothetical protein